MCVFPATTLALNFELKERKQLLKSMYQQQEVHQFFQAVCQDKTLQNKLKHPCPTNRRWFTDVAQESGYNFTTKDIDNYVRFYQFYKEFQIAIESHQSDSTELSDWLKKWQRHIQLYDQNPLDDYRDTIRRYI